MSLLSPASSAALSRLRTYRPPSASVYTSLPLSRRAAVLVLLFADPRGDLRVVLTMRSPLLRTFAGQVALPGGKADFLEETAWMTARREAWEEIGLPMHGVDVEHLAELPCTLARTLLGVRPCVAFLKENAGEMVPRLQEGEVEGVFTVRLEPFLSRKYPLRGGKEEPWYDSKGSVGWVGRRWCMHEFSAPVWEKGQVRRHRVWGMTARILVDVARVAYGRDPEFAFDKDIGFEDAIWQLKKEGKMEEVPKKPDPEVEPEKVVEEAARKGSSNL
ncbi:NUDIX hydrolase domain-like protein [Sphaerosporella brunnea]|uniref:NUDIX hydrolase domain-like protein n=1 Tax=Sphaerosporella brunnea TaxID=1250544 RepID=A0A5J5ELS5_9PEZI|nr:NUDIX hydrolase domain-like protein [Sphaerosporella brunnea]